MEETALYQGTGRRKQSVARVTLVPGSGTLEVNGRSVESYFNRDALVRIIEEPFEVTDTGGRFDTIVKVYGGGISGQAGAIRHGIARALLEADEEYRVQLKKNGFLTRDPRMIERKKYGKKKARKKSQFSKR